MDTRCRRFVLTPVEEGTSTKTSTTLMVVGILLVLICSTALALS